MCEREHMCLWGVLCGELEPRRVGLVRVLRVCKSVTSTFKCLWESLRTMADVHRRLKHEVDWLPFGMPLARMSAWQERCLWTDTKIGHAELVNATTAGEQGCLMCCGCRIDRAYVVQDKQSRAEQIMLDPHSLSQNALRIFIIFVDGHVFSVASKISKWTFFFLTYCVV